MSKTFSNIAKLINASPFNTYISISLPKGNLNRNRIKIIGEAIIRNTVFLLSITQVNQTLRTSLIGSGHCRYLTKLSGVKIFQRAFSFFSFVFLLRLVFVFSFFF